MTNVLMFHGTGGHPEENWFPWLRKELEALGCRVFVPQFPTPQNQTPEAWFKVFEEYADHLTPDTILIGHSLGGTFALRILENAQTSIKAAFIIAAPIGILPIKNYETDRQFVENPFDWAKIRKSCKKFFVFHSEDDPLVSVANGWELAKNLGVDMIYSKNSGHFNEKTGYAKFEKLLELVKEELR
ncbi:Serine hydrolase [Candidatus Burarchaeum australiense]|nr:Serine hydrolase [Candidatus Burarchaeum australiense]